ncbi:hypothetical protein M758_UG083000, partial [Ceratodon purpureus]
MEAEMLGMTTVDSIGYTTSHIVTYRRPEQVLNENNILQSLGGRDIEEIVTLSSFWHPKGRAIQVVYHDWLVDSLEAGELLEVEKYVAVKYVGS